MDYYPQAVALNGKVYVGGGDALTVAERTSVMVYDLLNDSWSVLPRYNRYWFAMAVLKGQLVLVGGQDVRTGKVTNSLGAWDKNLQGWRTHAFPPMRTACHSPSVASYNDQWLVVAGGQGDGPQLHRYTTFTGVDALNSHSNLWYICAPLPQPAYKMTAVVLDNSLVLLGGADYNCYFEKVFRVCLDELISQAVPNPIFDASAPLVPSPWQILPDTPFNCSTALALNGCLFAVGGGWSSAIHLYQPSSLKWVQAGELPTNRSQCCACTVPTTGEVFVAGGVEQGTEERVDIAQIFDLANCTKL